MADRFAKIAMDWNTVRKEKLKESMPAKFLKKVCSMNEDISEGIPLSKKIDTKEELYSALKEIKEQYREYLKDYAPEVITCNRTIPIVDFTLDDTEQIQIPHYGGPLGNAIHKYESEFELTEEFTDKAVYICFDGVDYEAGVYINGHCVGVHEGFFSPFEFEITDWVNKGKNDLKVMVKNDFIYVGNSIDAREEVLICGDKLYAASGLGYDDPYTGWHHCPAGMGIYNSVRVEVRNRVNIADIYVRPLPEEKKAELWVEVENADYIEKDLTFVVSVYGQNFEKEVIRDYEWNDVSMPAEHGKNIYKIMLDFDEVQWWRPEQPYLYQAQVSVWYQGKRSDMKKQQFGMRSFYQDTESTPKGMFYLNGRKIRLRGANTMGFEQQDVMRGDIEQLIDDILLAKLCNMNFFRLTQRPVQDEVYEYCDRLGLMTQTDLPLFGCMRRTKFAEGVRQTEKMVRLVRKHPCNVVISYINEPFPNGYGKPHRNMLRPEMESFFEACDSIAKLNMPDCVIKHVDGDYDPPTRNSMSDNHCYTLWYNGHGIDFGKLYRGYWIERDPDWYCGCGEYGAEALDYKELMYRRYPKEWLKEPFHPDNIMLAQSGKHHGFFMETPKTIDEWVEDTQAHQAFAAQMMTESFRRNADMISNAIHVFIDAWPSGWMKSIMDCERNPKPAYFACRNAMEPVLVSLRSDRFTYYENENISIEAFVCNDIDKVYRDHEIVFEVYRGGKKIQSGKERIASITGCDVTYICNAEFALSGIEDREKCFLRAILRDGEGKAVTYSDFSFEVFRDTGMVENENIIFIDDLSLGEHEIAGEMVHVYKAGGRYAVSRDTGHKAAEQFEKNDFRWWYDKEQDRMSPLVYHTFLADGFKPILMAVNETADAPKEQYVAAEKMYQGRRYVISTLKMRCENPIAKRFRKAIMEL